MSAGSKPPLPADIAKKALINLALKCTNTPVKWGENARNILTKFLTYPNTEIALWGGKTTKTKNAQMLYNSLNISALTHYHRTTPPSPYSIQNRHEIGPLSRSGQWDDTFWHLLAPFDTMPWARAESLDPKLAEIRPVWAPYT
jgi:hypothetical protein